MLKVSGSIWDTDEGGWKAKAKGEKYEAKENRSGFETVNAGWIRTRMWLGARATMYIKNKNKKIRTTVIFIQGPCSTGNVNIGQSSLIHSFKNTWSSLTMCKALFQCQEQSGTTPDLDSDCPPTLSIFWESCGFAGDSLWFVGSWGISVSNSVPQFVTTSAQSLIFSWHLCPKARAQSVESIFLHVLSLGKLCKPVESQLISENGKGKVVKGQWEEMS